MHIITRSATHTGTLPDDGIALRLGQVRNLQTAITEDHTRSVTWLCRWPIVFSHSEQGPSCIWFADWKYLGTFSDFQPKCSYCWEFLPISAYLAVFPVTFVFRLFQFGKFILP